MIGFVVETDSEAGFGVVTFRSEEAVERLICPLRFDVPKRGFEADFGEVAAGLLIDPLRGVVEAQEGAFGRWGLRVGDVVELRE